MDVVGLAIGSLLMMALAIYILSIVTDEFFITSLDRISQIWNLPANVAGASLMAMGSSAPELAIALLALFRGGGEYSDLGIGTIVGSAVFNILVITGASAIVKPAKITLTVVARDCIAYLTSIILLLFCFADSEITVYEAGLFVAFYGVYILVLFQWGKLMPEEEVEAEVEVQGSLEKLPEETEAVMGPGLYQKVTHAIAGGIGTLAGDAYREYPRAFVVSILFIAFLSWLLVESAVVFAGAVGIPPVIVALTLLAGGTSAPDFISSIVVSRQGRGDMAVANAVGSNIFNILMGLGMPWLVVILMDGGTVTVDTDGLWVSTIVLFGTVLVLFGFLYTDRLLTRREGYALIGVYLIYITWTVSNALLLT